MLLKISVLQSKLCVFVFLHLICFASPVWRIVFFAVFSEICLSLSEGAQTNRGVSFTVLGKWTECGGSAHCQKFRRNPPCADMPGISYPFMMQ